MKIKNKLYGAILGDLAGQPYEFDKTYKKPFRIHNPDSHITDDSILTLASAFAYMNNLGISDIYKTFAINYNGDYYGKSFREWFNKPGENIGTSYGNGSIMRISPFMYVDNSLEWIMKSIMTSHHHEESYESAIRLYNLYKNKNLPESVQKPSKITTFSSRAITSIEFCESVYFYTKSTHTAIEKAVKCGGDTDTHASIVGELSNYMYNDITKQDVEYVDSKLDKKLRNILKNFNKIV